MPDHSERANEEAIQEEADCRADADEREPPSVITEREVEDIEEHSRLRTPVIYEIVRREGEAEMERPAISLLWSGIAAGVSISFSLLAQAALYIHLPAAGWRPLVSGFGYSFGFLIVVLGHQQLFTENTVTVVLPVAAEFTAANLRALLRMWAIVFAANMIGTLVAALFWNFAPVLTPELHAAMFEISRHAMASGPVSMFFKGIAAGFLIAAMVWLLPSAEGAQFHIVTILTYLIAIGGFAHIVAGSVEVFMLLVSGQLGFGSLLVGFIIPVLAGNVIGGTALFALISYAQVMREI